MPEPDSRTGVNMFSVGIELVATADSGFTDEQYTNLAAVCAAVARRWGPRMRVLGNEHVAGELAVAMGLREEPKTDPGSCFDWSHFAQLLPGRARAEAQGLSFEV